MVSQSWRNIGHFCLGVVRPAYLRKASATVSASLMKESVKKGRKKDRERVRKRERRRGTKKRRAS